MTHLHSVNGTEARFSINPATRKISRTSGEKVVLIQGDHNSKRFYFDMPRYIEDHDMSLCNKVEVHYVNIEAKSSATKPGLYEVDDLEIVADDERSVCFTWLVSGNATELIGMLSFLIKFVCTDEEGNSVYKWHTAICSTPEVQGGMCNTEIIVEKYADVLEQWRERLFGNDTVKTVNGVGPDENGNVQIELEAGVTSWNDLTDKPFGVENSIIEINSFGTDGGLTFIQEGDMYGAQDAFDITLELGKKYIVNQFPDYICECKSIQGIPCIGNPALLGAFDEEDTGEPFLVLDINTNGRADIVLAETPPDMFFVTEVEVTENVKTLDPQFIPDEIARTKDVVKTSDLQTAVDEALTQAKESGEFDGENGKDGHTPVKGTDYFTDEDINEIVNTVYEKVVNGNEVAY